MIALLVALQIAAAMPQPLVVRNATDAVQVSLVNGAGGPMLRPQSLAPIVPVLVRAPSIGHYSVTIAGAQFDMEPGMAFVRVNGEIRQLAAAPELRRGELYVPLQLVAELVPELGTNVRWDADKRTLVVFASGDKGPRRPVTRVAGKPPMASPSVESRGQARRIVVVDAGHGGPDAGMHGPIGGRALISEKNITLAVSKRLGSALRARGVGVVYTRTTDTLIALSDRGRIANRSHGDLFISIHVNAANPNWRDPSASRGFETYFLAEARTEDARRVEQMENEAVRFEDSPTLSKDDPLGFILSDMVQNEHLRESSELAETIQRRLGMIHPGPSRGVKQAGFRVLVTAYMPAVLVEIGFGTNPAEAQFLSTPSKQQAIADAVADGAMEYLSRYERRVNGAPQ